MSPTDYLPGSSLTQQLADCTGPTLAAGDAVRCLQLNFLDEQHAVYLSGVTHSSYRRVVEHRNAGFDLLTKHMVISIMEPWLLGSVSMVLLAFGFSDLLCFKPFRLCQPRSWDYSPSGSSSPPFCTSQHD